MPDASKPTPLKPKKQVTIKLRDPALATHQPPDTKKKRKKKRKVRDPHYNGMYAPPSFRDAFNRISQSDDNEDRAYYTQPH